MAVHRQYSEKTDREIARRLARDRQDKTFDIGPVPPEEIGTTRHYRFAKTGVTAVCPAYPDRPANTFPIILGKMIYDNTSCGCKAVTFTAYPKPEHRIACDFNDNYHVEGKIVKVFLAHGLWWIDSEPVVNAEAILAEHMCATDTEPVVTDFRELPACDLVDPAPLIKNLNKHRGPAGSRLILIKKKCERGEDCIGSQEWHVVDVELRDYCAVVGLDDRESCLVAAGLRLGGEWCPADEPVVACPIVLYIDCILDLPPCETAWSFDAQFACCGQAGTEEAGGSTSSSFEDGDGQPPPGQFGPGPSPDWFPPM